VDQLIPFIESCPSNFFDRHGERARKIKARMKFLVERLGLGYFSRFSRGREKKRPFHFQVILFKLRKYEAKQLLPNPEKQNLDKGVSLGGFLSFGS